MILLLDGLTPKYNVIIEVFDKGGKLLQKKFLHNLVTTSGRNLIRDLLAGDITGGLKTFALGTDSTPVDASDTGLGDLKHSGDISERIKEDGKLTLKYFLPTKEGNGITFNEAGLFGGDNGDHMYARVLIPEGLNKNEGISVVFTWVLSWVD